MTNCARSLALINGEIYPFASPGKASAIFSRGGLVEALGTDREVLALCDPETVVLDLHGATVLPGFVDAGLPLPLSPEELRALLASLASAGLTLIQCDCREPEGEGDVLEALSEMDKAGSLPLRVMPQRLARSLSDVETFIGSGDDACSGEGMLSFGPLKIVLDGFLDNRTAALSEDYCDTPGDKGQLRLDPEELFGMILAADRAGCGVALHAVGDAAIGQAIDALARVAGAEGSLRVRHRIVHCAAGSAEYYAKIASLGVAVEIRPFRVGIDWPIILSRLGSERARTTYAWKTLLRKGVVLCAGSGYFAKSFSPVEGIRAMIVRRDAEGRPAEGWMPNEALDRPEAFWLYTGGASEALGLSGERGTLVPGKVADMVVLVKNPFAVSLRELTSIEIGMTISGGRIRKIV